MRIHFKLIHRIILNFITFFFLQWSFNQKHYLKTSVLMLSYSRDKECKTRHGPLEFNITQRASCLPYTDPDCRCAWQEPLEFRSKWWQQWWRGQWRRRLRRRQRERRRGWRRCWRRRIFRPILHSSPRFTQTDPRDPHWQRSRLRPSGQSATAGNTSLCHPRGAHLSGKLLLQEACSLFLTS